MIKQGSEGNGRTDMKGQHETRRKNPVEVPKFISRCQAHRDSPFAFVEVNLSQSQALTSDTDKSEQVISKQEHCC